MNEHFTNIAHGVLWYDSVQISRAILEPQFVAFLSPLMSPFSSPTVQSRTISVLMHIYFGCIMLIRNLLQDTVGDIRIRKLLETSQTLSGLDLSCDTIKRKHHRSHFTTHVERVRFFSKLRETETLETTQQSLLVTWISSDASFYQVFSTLCVLFFLNNTSNSLNNPA